ncbi:MAG: mannose-1-phosphate guanylyltransferase [Anaerolineales bacterium]
MNDLAHTYALIMAGGGGTRLWPLSRRNRPKQVLPLVEKRSLFQTTFERLESLFPPERILVVTVQEQAEALKLQVPDIPDENFLLEPAPRGTASAIGLGAVALKKRDSQAVMAVLPADHYIRNQALFSRLVRTAVTVAQKGYLVTMGIAPTYPATIYGYIQSDAPLPEPFDYPVHHVVRFIEKPQEEQARALIETGNCSWNSGMFFWKVDDLLAEMSRQMPDLHAVLTQIGAAWGTDQQESTLKALWPGLRNETIDYGIMEHAERVAVLPASELEWNDIGNWNSLFDVLPADENGNIVFGSHHVTVDTSNSLVYGNHGDHLIVTIGVEDLVIVDSGNALLICHKGQAARVRQIVEKLKNSDREHYT